MNNPAQIPEGVDNRQIPKWSPWKVKAMALLMPFSGGIAQAQNLVAATTNTTPVAGETGTTVDPYGRHRKALEWLVKESAKSTPDTSDDALSTQGGLYKLLVDDITDDGTLNSTNRGIVWSLAKTITEWNPGDALRVQFANTAGKLLVGENLVAGSVANATPVVPVEAEVNIEGKKPALGSKEEEKLDVDPIFDELKTFEQARNKDLISFSNNKITISYPLGVKDGSYSWFKKTIELSWSQRKKDFFVSHSTPKEWAEIIVKVTFLDSKWLPIWKQEQSVENNMPFSLPDETRWMTVIVTSAWWDTSLSKDRTYLSWTINEIWFVDKQKKEKVTSTN